MRIEHYDNHLELCEYMIDKAQDGFYTVAVLYYADAMKLLAEFMCYDDIKKMFIDIENPEIDNYDREYYISLNGDMELFVEKAYCNGRYLGTDAMLTLIHGTAHYNAVADIPEYACREIYFGKEYDDDFAEGEQDRIRR